ncbi:hypothetical protein lbkm_2378 [Lachnospiraceae bacterium KM106-2]|nr:hypothetical protein lbkm_2378 [Lachnospiraceae bacterium KM106-2]
MIKKESILTLHFFDYGEAFTGSDGNMRYRMMKVEHEVEEEKKEAKLLVTVWPGPYAYDHTEEEKKQSREFAFSEEGKSAAVDWLNEEYEKSYT